jgi:N-acetyl-anhydromuramyl-L-alanine amidase AmpD
MALPEYPSAHTFASPNYNERPQGMGVSAIVLHATVGEASPSLNWLVNPSSQVSCHYLIDRDGAVYQLVEEQDRAWHAGPSFYAGLNDWNNFSIGIEMVNRNDGVDPYNPPLVEACKQLCIYLVAKYGIAREMIVTHQMISGALTGKSDPKGFPLANFVNAVMTSLPPPVRQAAWLSLGLPYNSEAALQEKATELGLGHPMTNELRAVIRGVRWVFQAYDGGIVGTEEGNWANVRKIDWM